MFKKQPRMEVVAAAEGKKSCLVVGAGASGLAVMKELTARPDDAHDVVVTDRVQRLQ